jgi:hypothetical protein
MNKFEAGFSLLLLMVLFPVIIGFGMEVFGYTFKHALVACAVYGALAVNSWIKCIKILAGKE